MSINGIKTAFKVGSFRRFHRFAREFGIPSWGMMISFRIRLPRLRLKTLHWNPRNVRNLRRQKLQHVNLCRNFSRWNVKKTKEDELELRSAIWVDAVSVPRLFLVSEFVRLPRLLTPSIHLIRFHGGWPVCQPQNSPNQKTNNIRDSCIFKWNERKALF